MLSIIRLVLTCFTFSFAHASIIKCKKRKASTLLQDANNDIVPVQPVNSDIVMQNASQQHQQLVVQRGNVIQEPFMVMLDGGKFYHSIPASHIFTEMERTGYSSLFSNITFGDHVIGFRFYYARGMLSLRLTLSSFTGGQITTRLKFFMNTTGEPMQKVASSIPTNTPLTDGMDIPLCKLRDIYHLVQNNAIIDLDVEMLIDPAHHDIFMPCPPHDQKFLRKIQTFPQRIKRLIDGRRYNEIIKYGKNMCACKFRAHIFPAIRTLEQYEGIVDYLKSCDLTTTFYAYGDIEVVKKVVVKSRVYENTAYVHHHGELESALAWAFERNEHRRVIELLKIRQEITTEEDKQLKQQGRMSTFEAFVMNLFTLLSPWKDDMALKRFLTCHRDLVKDEFPNFIYNLYQTLLCYLSYLVEGPKAKKPLTDLIGQPSLMAPVPPTRIFPYHVDDKFRSNFIRYAWREVVEECLMKEYPGGGEELWRVMKVERPNQFVGDYPHSDDAFAAVLAKFPTKRELEELWVNDNAPGFLEAIGETLSGILPIVLVSIIIEYGRPDWIDVLSINPSRNEFSNFLITFDSCIDDQE